MYVGGKQARPDGGASYAVLDPAGRAIGQAGLGNRKDIRNAVEAAAKATGWAGRPRTTGRRCSTMSPRTCRPERAEFAARLKAMTGRGRAQAEVEAVGAAAVLLCGLRRQVRRGGPRDAEEVRDPGDERALGRDGDRLPGRGAAAGAGLAGRAGDRDGQCGRHRPSAAHPLARRTSIPCWTRRTFRAAWSTS